MSNNKKWKNKKINLDTYKSASEVKKERNKKQLSMSWKISLVALFLVAIPSFLVFLIFGADGWIIPALKQMIDANPWKRWTIYLPISLAIAGVQFAIISLLIWKFKVLQPSALNFLVAVVLAMNSFLVSSGAESGKWWIRVLPAIGLAFLAIPVIAINRAVAKKKLRVEEQKIKEEEKKIKSLLD